MMMEAMSNADSVVTAATIWNWTDKDPVLGQANDLVWVVATGR